MLHRTRLSLVRHFHDFASIAIFHPYWCRDSSSDAHIVFIDFLTSWNWRWLDWNTNVIRVFSVRCLSPIWRESLFLCSVLERGVFNSVCFWTASQTLRIVNEERDECVTNVGSQSSIRDDTLWHVRSNLGYEQLGTEDGSGILFIFRAIGVTVGPKSIQETVSTSVRFLQTWLRAQTVSMLKRWNTGPVDSYWHILRLLKHWMPSKTKQ